MQMQDILLNARKLTDRLKEDETAADALLSQAQNVYKQIDAMKHYADDLANLNETISGNSQKREVLVDLQHENKQMCEIQVENRELKIALQDYQNAVELIMSKYRTHATQLVSSNQIDMKAVINQQQNDIIEQQANKISEMAAVMLQSAKYMDQTHNYYEKEIAQLRIENDGLRKLLAISNKYNPQPVKDEEANHNATVIERTHDINN